ncbi:MAG: methyltransferase domain-containing protein [Thiogranum sp.]|nr:methyltransferase domain-containing protein [Thiogranum sp.]
MIEDIDGTMAVAHPLQWNCPVCGTSLQGQDRQLVCAQKHSFDIAKEGYVNLLPSHHKRSADPGDDRHMLDSRRAFLARGYYQPLVENLVDWCTRLALEAGPPFAVLDTGCGEGYYTEAIAEAVVNALMPEQCWCGAIDIARHAVRMAARRTRLVHYAVASNAAIPLPSESIDCVLQIFAPGYAQEVLRILKPGGWFIAVTPGPRHLQGLRRLVYDQPREHTPAATDSSDLRHVERFHLDFTIQVQGKQDVNNLLAMTPYFWQASRTKQAAIAALDVLDTDVSFIIDSYCRDE